ncbi:TonB-dependent receptor [Neptunicella marina]|uniref:TonB-dependent receptor n=1 Tax=Neptunicella marina TaxID=2125989 RepID=A0A8J6IST8_9ALTE|nr:carboxypeptidase regulatory-like domain-containing protein [Neptunicella marina]MBC3765659.1 TonB-dependent receptor [Neptunicella marina]
MAKQPIAFMKKRLVQATSAVWQAPAKALPAVMLAGALLSAPAMAQQAGGIKGKITSAEQALSGVTVTATSNVMPKPRTTVTKADGSYVLPLLLPGTYELTFTSPDGTVRKTTVTVLLDQTSNASIAMDATPASDTEIITITGSTMVREGNSSLTNAINEDVLDKVPVGQSYRDLLKIIPGVQYSENATLGPSAGGSGRDNKYGFDGVDVSLPMFGNLASEPSTHDIANVSIDRGGAKAIGFNRSGGFAINTTSKSGTNEFKGSVEYKIQNKNFVSDRDDTDGTKYTLDKSWLTANLSGPIIEDELFFYGSYYRPETTRESKETAYGPAKDYEVIRDEYFGKLTWAPTSDLLFNLSKRYSENEGSGLSVGANDADSTSQGSLVKQDILTFDGSYLIDDFTTLSFQYSDFKNENGGGPDTNFDNVVPKLGESLNLDMLDQLGLFTVPNIRDGVEGYDNDTAQSLINKYGYVGDDGSRVGGGSIGGASTYNDQNFYRKTLQIKLDHEMEWGDMYHQLHFGIEWKEGKEVLSRSSNGWGSITYLGGLAADDFDSDVPVYYQARVEQMSFVDETGSAIPAITSTSETYNIEVNDTIEDGDFTYNIGFLFSQDTLYGQGLKKNSNNVSGYELAPGHKYEMYKLDFLDMIQPRLGVTWTYNGQDTLFANFASYNPDTSSLARAASWARNLASTRLVYFDENGDFIGNTNANGSSGKFFQDDLQARRTDEFTVGATKVMSDHLFLRGHIRHRKALHPWEDVPNGARLYGEYGPFGGVPAHIAEKGLYIPNLDEMRAEVGGSSYVIAELDEASNKYWEVSMEAEYSTDNIYLNASYVWSHYYGNYDQDVTSGSSDANLFVGSSNLGDGKGRMPWDGKSGNLHGDVPHILKAFGYYTTDWNANIGANFVFQSGNVWETWDGSVYGYSSSTIRYSEPAGSRREPSHWQLDLNYEQKFELMDDLMLTFRADVFNLFDNQTGYNYDPYLSNTTYGKPRNLITPRRLQLSFNVEF